MPLGKSPGGSAMIRMLRRIIRWPVCLPERLRFAWCEISGGHHFEPYEAWSREETLGYRVQCRRCFRGTRWFRRGEGRERARSAKGEAS